MAGTKGMKSPAIPLTDDKARLLRPRDRPINGRNWLELCLFNIPEMSCMILIPGVSLLITGCVLTGVTCMQSSCDDNLSYTNILILALGLSFTIAGVTLTIILFLRINPRIIKGSDKEKLLQRKVGSSPQHVQGDNVFVTSHAKTQSDNAATVVPPDTSAKTVAAPTQYDNLAQSDSDQPHNSVSAWANTTDNQGQGESAEDTRNRQHEEYYRKEKEYNKHRTQSHNTDTKPVYQASGRSHDQSEVKGDSEGQSGSERRGAKYKSRSRDNTERSKDTDNEVKVKDFEADDVV